MESLQISCEHSRNHHYGSAHVGFNTHKQAFLAANDIFVYLKWGSMHYGSLGSYVSLPLLIKTTHLKEEEFNFLFIICKMPTSNFYHSLLMTGKCLPQNSKASCQKILKVSLTGLEIKDSPFIKSYGRGLHFLLLQRDRYSLPLAKVCAFYSWVSSG